MLCHVIPICHFGPLLAWNGQNDEMVTGCNFFSWNEPRWQNCDCWAHFRGATIFLQVSWPIFELQWPGQNSKMVTLGSIKVQTFLESSDVINARTCHFSTGNGKECETLLQQWDAIIFLLLTCSYICHFGPFLEPKSQVGKILTCGSIMVHTPPETPDMDNSRLSYLSMGCGQECEAYLHCWAAVTMFQLSFWPIV
jgi:hypothetical protein